MITIANIAITIHENTEEGPTPKMLCTSNVYQWTISNMTMVFRENNCHKYLENIKTDAPSSQQQVLAPVFCLLLAQFHCLINT